MNGMLNMLLASDNIGGIFEAFPVIKIILLVIMLLCAIFIICVVLFVLCAGGGFRRSYFVLIDGDFRLFPGAEAAFFRFGRLCGRKFMPIIYRFIRFQYEKRKQKIPRG